MNAANYFPLNTRVVINGHGGWPDGTTGVVVTFPDFVKEMVEQASPQDDEFIGDDVARLFNGPNGQIITQFVVFDEPVDDGSGDGPYQASEINHEYLKTSTHAQH